MIGTPPWADGILPGDVKMSTQSAKDFLVKIATDEDAAKHAQSAHEQALVRLGESLGYTFDATELRDALAAIDELPEQALEGVAGGYILSSLSLQPLSPLTRSITGIGVLKPRTGQYDSLF